VQGYLVRIIFAFDLLSVPRAIRSMDELAKNLLGPCLTDE